SHIVGRSVTDLEIEFGVLSDTAHRARCFFYFREQLPYGDMPIELAGLYSDAYAQDAQASVRIERLCTLKERIEATFPNRVRRYVADWDRERQRVSRLEAWGQAVLQDIWQELDSECPAAQADATLSWQNEEAIALDDYVEDRAREFVGRQPVIAQLIEHALSPDVPSQAWGMCITAPSGGGKSALFGELLRQLRSSGVLVLAHAAGASSRSRSVELMLRRWIAELASVLGVDPHLPEDVGIDVVETKFRTLLTNATAMQRVVVLVDALDQFEDTARARKMTWLPTVALSNIRLIATAISGRVSEALLNRRGCEALQLPSLNEVEALDIARAISARYRRQLEPEVLVALLTKPASGSPACGNPLWLNLAVEELNLLDADDFARASRAYSGAPAEQLRALMLDLIAAMPADVPGLYKAAFTRAEHLFGMFLARAFVGLIAISRSGWREADFRSLLPRATSEPWDTLRFASLRRLFRGQVRQRGHSGQWTFTHAQMHAAAHDFIAAQSVSAAEFHTEAAEHLLALPQDDTLRITEAMVHLIGSGDWNRASEFYGDPELTASERSGAGRVLADALVARDTADLGLLQVQHLLEAHGDNVASSAVIGTVAERLLHDVGSWINDRAQIGVQIALYRLLVSTFTKLAEAEDGNTRWQRNLALAQDRIANSLIQEGNLKVALQTYRESLNIKERLHAIDSANTTWQRELALGYLNFAHIRVTETALPAALRIYKKAQVV
ncbi:MAG: ATP-binding protein, partial [Hyphomicrobium sp.]